MTKTSIPNNHKSPFLIQQEFLSPLLCDVVTDHLADSFLDYNTTKEGDPLPTECVNKEIEDLIVERVEKHLLTVVEQYYNVQIANMTQPINYWYPDGCSTSPVTCDNSKYISNKWQKVKRRDLSVCIFLSQYSKETPFDTDYEVYGGKLEFPQYNFGFQAERGTAVVYPSDPHFLNSVGTVYAGDLLLTKFYLVTDKTYLYDPSEFQGSYQTWFSNLI